MSPAAVALNSNRVPKRSAWRRARVQVRPRREKQAQGESPDERAQRQALGRVVVERLLQEERQPAEERGEADGQEREREGQRHGDRLAGRGGGGPGRVILRGAGGGGKARHFPKPQPLAPPPARCYHRQSRHHSPDLRAPVHLARALVMLRRLAVFTACAALIAGASPSPGQSPGELKELEKLLKAASDKSADSTDKKFPDFAVVTKGAKVTDGLFTLHQKGRARLHGDSARPVRPAVPACRSRWRRARGWAATRWSSARSGVISFKRVDDRVFLIRKNTRFRASPRHAGREGRRDRLLRLGAAQRAGADAQPVEGVGGDRP